ncbi:DUF983 domain-containing protein [Siccirubricoccus sp. KC 17139]|uniref:DUF983 domain-containing protein n=1 Tax=Siccirubricoccus soli TaxID=2899147 RepID=A0ABT1D4S8_9PROT|nr:DUF983 domain-containing protein [Siccirubricoccus soli]MCO6416869.1 DUF983 domain-containing protein [Siccirubricoccus soli]MCP2683004.1 DUF983 domain-containing protein [Siccirubricoccus soli]
MGEGSRVWLGMRRGLALRCPNCGEGRLFAGFLKLRSPCEACGEDNSAYPSDDAPPYLTLVLVGHVILPFMFWSDRVFAPAMWVQFAIWLPLVTLMTVALLPFMKGAVIGFAWANGVTRNPAAGR